MSREKAIKQWQNLKFGLFIHFGLYALEGKGEWYMYHNRVPVKEYRKLAEKFNPTEFNPHDWVKIAKKAGMKYIIITTKHHDGFSMFKSDVTDYNIVDATPYSKDLIKQLADACRDENMKLGFYYSHVREWNHPLAQSFEKKGCSNLFGNYGNYWDYPDESKKDLQKYIEEFDIPQLKELLTNYGDILTIWFDTPSHISIKDSERIRDFVYTIQPDCLVNGRLCSSTDVKIDYISMGDNQIPCFSLNTPWETAATTSDAWGFVQNSSYESSYDILKKLVEVITKGGNFLLNVGPDSKGIIPAPAQSLLFEIGDWVEKNSEAIYDITPIELTYFCDWGYVAKKDNFLYLYITEYSYTKIGFTGITNTLRSCTILENNAPIEFTQSHDFEKNVHSFEINTQNMCKSSTVTVVKAEFDSPPELVLGIIPDYDGNILLTADRAIPSLSQDSNMQISYSGTKYWYDKSDYLTWNFSVAEKGDYKLYAVVAGSPFWKKEDFGHTAKVITPNESFVVEINKDTDEFLSSYQIYLGDCSLEEGENCIKFIPEKINSENTVGLQLIALKICKIIS